jgi:hypothetical protein
MDDFKASLEGHRMVEAQLLLGLEKSHWVTIGSAFVAASVICVGWFATSSLTSERDYKNKQREMKIEYLVDAYDKLALSSNRELTPEFATMLEIATAKIQLFGSPQDIVLLHKFLDEWTESGKAGRPRRNLDALLFALRNSLRNELTLPEVDTQIRWIRPRGGAQ